MKIILKSCHHCISNCHRERVETEAKRPPENRVIVLAWYVWNLCFNTIAQADYCYWDRAGYSQPCYTRIGHSLRVWLFTKFTVWCDVSRWCHNLIRFQYSRRRHCLRKRTPITSTFIRQSLWVWNDTIDTSERFLSNYTQQNKAPHFWNNCKIW